MRFIRKFRIQHPVAFFLSLFLVCFAVGVGISSAIGDNANAATSSRICTPNANPDLVCWTPSKYATKFRNGYFHRTHGFPAKRVYYHPAKARRAWVSRIKTYYQNHPRRARIERKHFGVTNARSAGCTDYCLAWQTYGELMAKSNCTGYAYPTRNTNTCVYPTTHKISAKWVARAGTLAFCGTTVVLGVVGSAGSDGAATPAMVGMVGGLSCGWSFWSSFL
jgi:hypothetical protein